MRATHVTYWIEPISILSNPSLDPSDYVHTNQLVFQLQHDGKFLPVTDWDNHQYRYRCMGCYLASGSDYAFATDYAKAKNLKDGPTKEQEDQMGEHAKQHQIMFSWARSLKWG